MTRKDKYRYLMRLHYHALSHPELWVVDKSDDLNKCDLYSPSKDRLFAYELDGTNTIIYLDEESFKTYWRQDDAMYKNFDRYSKRMISTDYLYETYKYELSNCRRIPTSDSPLGTSSLDEEDYNLMISNISTNLFMETLTSEEKNIVNLLLDGYKTREIASKIGVSQTAVVKKTKKIKEKLKKFHF